MPNLPDRLKQARIEAGFERQADVIRAFGWTTQYYQHENGHSEPSKEALVKYARAFSVRLEWLMTGNGSPNDKQRRVPVMGTLERGLRVKKTSLAGGSSFHLTHTGDDVSQFCVTVQDDDNHPLFAEGDVIFGGADEDPANLIGKQAIVVLDEGATLLRMIEAGTKPGHYMLMSLGLGEAPLRDVQIVRAARIVWIKKA